MAFTGFVDGEGGVILFGGLEGESLAGRELGFLGFEAGVECFYGL